MVPKFLDSSFQIWPTFAYIRIPGPNSILVGKQEAKFCPLGFVEDWDLNNNGFSSLLQWKIKNVIMTCITDFSWWLLISWDRNKEIWRKSKTKTRTIKKNKFYLWRYTPVWMTMASATSSTSSLVSRSLPWNYRSTKWRWPLNLTRSNTLRHFPRKTLMNFFTSQVQIYRRNFISTALGAVI